jgi:hypothetical protein
MNSGAGNKVPGWLYLLIILSVILMWVFFTSFKVKDSTLGSSPNQTVSFPQKPTEYSVQTLPTLSVGSAIRYNSSAVSPKEDFGCPSGCTTKMVATLKEMFRSKPKKKSTTFLVKSFIQKL